MAAYSQFGAPAQPVLYGDDEESKRRAQAAGSAPPPTPAPTASPYPPPGGMPAGGQLPGMPQSAPRPQAPAPAQPPAPRPTFAQMQAQGQARPAPVQLQSQSGVMESTGDMDLYRQQVQQIARVPTRFDDLAFMQMRNTAQNDLEAQFGNQRVSLDEELARRGLYDSTVAANQYRDLGGQQARAMANLDSQLLREMAQTQMQDRLASAGLAGQLASFGENSRQFDRQQSLAEQLGLGNLNLNRDQLTQQNEQFGRSLEQNDLARALQERLAMTEMSGVYQGANGQNYNTLGRDRLAVEREVGGNDLLIRLAGMLGMDGLAGIVGGKTDAGDENTPPPATGTNDEWSARRPGESVTQWFLRMQRAGGPPRTTTGTAAPQPGTGEATQPGGPTGPDEELMAQLQARLGGG